MLDYRYSLTLGLFEWFLNIPLANPSLLQLENLSAVSGT